MGLFRAGFESNWSYLPRVPGKFCRTRQILPGSSRARQIRARTVSAAPRKIDGWPILNPIRHDELVAWVSHMPQFVATALSALLEEWEEVSQEA